MTITMPALSAPDWCLTEDTLQTGQVEHYESIFALANGYMGVRASLDTSPLLGNPGFYVAGVYDQVAGFSHEIVNLPCWLDLGLWVDGFPVDLRKGTLLEYQRTLDLRQGILFSQLVWRDAAMHTTRFELARLVHRTDKHLAMQWGTITPLDYSANVRIRSSLDAWSVKYGSPSGAARLGDYATRDAGEAGIVMAVSTRVTAIRTALASSLVLENPTGRTVSQSDDRISEIFTAPMQQGVPLSFCKRVSVYTSRDGADPEAMAVQAGAALRESDPAAAIARHVSAWSSAWRDADIRITGDPRAQRATRFTVFHLMSLAHPEDTAVSIGAKGLHGNGYNGWVYWDTEIYLLPFYIYTQPETARALLEYRYRMLDDARANAADMGRRGAYYPWNSTLTGRERRHPGWQEHVGSDIAYGIDLYARATGDRAFLHGPGAEIILETARYWESRVETDPAKGFVITGLMGPDEIHGGIANNTFTNQLVKWHLERAASLADALKSDPAGASVLETLGVTAGETARWREIAAGMYLSFLPDLNIHQQFDDYLKLPDKAIDRSLSRMQYTGPVQHSFRPTRVAQQADTVLMYWMFNDLFPADVRQAGYAFYEPRCSHTSSLSRCIYAAVAAQTGMAGEALRQFIPAVETDIAAGAEMESENGVHVASMGGAWLALVTGFGGLSVRAEVLTLAPCLPPEWTGLAFTLRWRGVWVEVELQAGSARLRTRGGCVDACVGGQPVQVTPDWETHPLVNGSGLVNLPPDV